MTTIDQKIAEIISSLKIGDWAIGEFLLFTIALLLATLLCGAIGIERESRGRNAGLRTHLLVGVGSCLIMIVSIYGFPNIGGTDGTVFNRDVARLAAQVITGVGFLGAGAIIHRNSGTKGLTTAATIWIVMAIGLACGSMNFILATGATILILIVLISFRKFEKRINSRSPMLCIHCKKDSPILSKLMDVTDRLGFGIRDLSSDVDENGNLEIFFVARNDNKEESNLILLLSEIRLIDGVIDVQTMNLSNK